MIKINMQIILINKHAQKFQIYRILITMRLLKTKHLNKYMKINFQKKRNKYGIYKIKVYTDKSYIKQKKIEYSKSIKFKCKKYLHS